jgi:hypothetical protein
VQHLLNSIDWNFRVDPWERGRDQKLLDTREARDRLKAVHVLAEAGPRWAPKGADELNSVRRSLLKVVPEYTAEVVRIMAYYKACTKECLQGLLRTQSMKAHTSEHSSLIAKLVSSLP